MTVTKELEAKILRFYHVEKWRVGTLSRELNIHHSVVERVLSQTGIPKTNILSGKSMIMPYLPFIIETLDKHPKLAASRLYDMVCARGYAGAPSHFRHLISLHRPRPAAEAYLRLRTLPGEQAQVDWGHFGYVTIGRAKRPLVAFVMVLSYSRKIFLRFYLNQRMSNFLHGHEEAFNAWGGVPKVCLYDNLKSAVLERQGDAIRFNPTLLDFSAHYRFEPRPVAVCRGNEKGRVERAIRYVRDNFFAARAFADVVDLNVQATQWCEGQASNRPCPEERSCSVKNVFENEQRYLLALPATGYAVDEQESVHVGKTPYVRFDLNDYSVPHRYVRRTLAVNATLDNVTILNGAEVIAQHHRSYDKGQQIEDNTHIQALIDSKKQARHHRAQDRLTHAAPSAAILLIKAAERHYHMGSITRALIQLLDDYGAAELEVAIQEAISKDVPHPNAVQISLQKRREQRHQYPPINLDLPDDKRIREQVVRVHKLNDYDQLQSNATEQHHDC